MSNVIGMKCHGCIEKIERLMNASLKNQTYYTNIV